jgi:hypothetical protein
LKLSTGCKENSSPKFCCPFLYKCCEQRVN